MDFEIIRYSPTMSRQWDSFVKESCNGVFLFERAYMDYHADRFTDHSLIAYKISAKSRTPIALLPANINGNTLYSHQGLTFGGWIFRTPPPDGHSILELLEALKDYCLAEGICEVIYKSIPFIYPAIPTQSDRYALWRMGATQVETNLSSALCPKSNTGFNTLQKRLLRKGRPLFECIEANVHKLPEFYETLTACLSERHAAIPVHSLPELEMLMTRFDKNIRLFMALDTEKKAQAGVLIYESENVAHCQYIASTPLGRQLHALPVLFDFLINKVFIEKKWFDFGTSNEYHGRFLNSGLIRQKHSFGASGVCHDIFSWKIEN